MLSNQPCWVGMPESLGNYCRVYLTQRNSHILASCSTVTPLSTSLFPCSDRHRGTAASPLPRRPPLGNSIPVSPSCSHPSITRRDSQLKREEKGITFHRKYYTLQYNQRTPPCLILLLGKEEESELLARGYRASSAPFSKPCRECIWFHLECRVHRACLLWLWDIVQFLSNEEFPLNNLWIGPSFIPNLILGEEDLCSLMPTQSPGTCQASVC